MKEYILLLLFIPFIQAKSQTSVYHPFPDSNTVWNFQASDYCWFSGGFYNYYSILIDGDTIIAGQIYKKLYTPSVVEVNNTNCSGWILGVLPGYRGAIRQDTSFKMVYMVPNGDTTEKLLYDFNLGVGDTVKGYTASSSFVPDIVISIDSILIGTTYRKRWFINPYYSIYWIEGVGSTFGLLNNSPGNISDHPGYNLTCFKQDNLVLYPDTATVCDVITVAVDEINTSHQIKIYPNPVSDEINISFTPGITSEAEIQIINILGKVEENFKLNKNQNDNVKKLKTTSLPSGLYFIRVNIDGSTVTKKLIKL